MRYDFFYISQVMLIINVIPHTVLGHKASEEINSVLKVQSPKTFLYTETCIH